MKMIQKLLVAAAFAAVTGSGLAMNRPTKPEVKGMQQSCRGYQEPKKVQKRDVNGSKALVPVKNSGTNVSAKPWNGYNVGTVSSGTIIVREKGFKQRSRM